MKRPDVFWWFWGLVLWMGFWQISCKGGTSGNVESDTTNLKKLANFVHDDERKAIINGPHAVLDTERVKGWPAWPQAYDDFRGRKMDTVFWDSRDLRFLDMRGATMRSAKCTNNNFSGSDFRVSDIRWTVFDGSVMMKCNFDQAKLFHVKVNNVILDSSTFRGANMFGMEGHGTMMRGCDFSNALMKDAEFLHANFTGSRGVKARLIRAVLKESIMDGTDFSYADFTGGGLEKVSFRGAKLRHANFQGARLMGADFSGADLYGANFFGSFFDKTSVKGARNIPPEVLNMMDKDSLVTGIWQDLKQHIKGR